MLINTSTGGRHEVRNIDHIRIKDHADGRWSLKIYPRAGDLLMPSGASESEVEVLPEEIQRIRTVAGHLIASIPPELKGERRTAPPPSAREQALNFAHDCRV
ncbi:MAG: hypothetical protein R6V26_11070 [Roseovarius sp.]